MGAPRRLAALMTGAITVSAACSMCAPALLAPPAGAALPHRAASFGRPRSLAVASLLPHVSPDEMRRAPGPTPAPSGQRAEAVRGTGTVGDVQYATNWSGEIALGGRYTTVSASWTVPSIVPTISPELVSTWVGIGGLTGTPVYPTLIQTGTVEITTGGVVAYHAWVELLPAPAMTLTTTRTPGGSASDTVSAGDVMRASVTNLGASRWQIALTDQTAGWAYTHDATYVVTQSSAEWITERPLTGTTLATLAEYSKARFTELEDAATGGTVKAPGTLTPVEMVDAGNVVSAPGPVSVSSSVGATFTDYYVSVPPRIYGVSADGTAAAAFEHQFAYLADDCPSSHALVLATDESYPDALSGAYLAGVLGTGTLLTPTSSLSPTAAAAIRSEGIARVYVVGGPLAVATSVVAQLQATPAYLCGGATATGEDLAVTRIDGQTEYGTAQQIALTAASIDSAGAPPSSAGVGSADLSGAYAALDAAGGEGEYNTTAGSGSQAPSTSAALPTAIVATGEGFQDAESASALAYADHFPVLLTDPDTLSSQAASAIQALGIEQVILMGGPLAVSDAVVTALEALSTTRPLSVLRVAGTNDVQTAVELARCELGSATSGAGLGWPAAGGVVVARGDFYADGLAAALVPGDGPSDADPEPLLLTTSPSIPGASLTTFLQEAGTTGIDGDLVTRLTILGGPFAVTQTAANTMAVALAT